jgi:hypothetical protein
MPLVEFMENKSSSFFMLEGKLTNCKHATLFLTLPNRYCCGNGHRFLCSNPGVLSQLPFHVQESFPFLLTRRAGITLELVKELRSCLAHGMGPAKVHHIIRENYTANHSKKALMYLDVIETIIQRQKSPGHQPAALEFKVPSPFPHLKPMPNFKSDEYAGKYPSGKMTLLLKSIEPFPSQIPYTLLAQVRSSAAALL